jgi:DNA-binding NarL/FixJ family response regulator
MKKFLLSLISTHLLRKKMKPSQETETKDNFQVINQRELEVLNLLAAGYNDSEIAGLLHTNERIIYQYKSNILGKTNLPNISSAIQYALQKELLRITCA